MEMVLRDESVTKKVHNLKGGKTIIQNFELLDRFDTD